MPIFGLIGENALASGQKRPKADMSCRNTRDPQRLALGEVSVPW